MNKERPDLVFGLIIPDTRPSVVTVSMISIKLDSLTEDEKQEHCRALSSDEDSFCEAESQASKNCHSWEPFSFSSGYSSIQSVSPSSSCSSSSPLMPCTFKTVATSLGTASSKGQPGFRLLVPMQRPRGTSTKQVKRKNSAAHSGGEIDREDEEEEYTAKPGFMSL